MCYYFADGVDIITQSWLGYVLWFTLDMLVYLSFDFVDLDMYFGWEYGGGFCFILAFKIVW